MELIWQVRMQHTFLCGFRSEELSCLMKNMIQDGTGIVTRFSEKS